MILSKRRIFEKTWSSSVSCAPGVRQHAFRGRHCVSPRSFPFFHPSVTDFVTPFDDFAKSRIWPYLSFLPRIKCGINYSRNPVILSNYGLPPRLPSGGQVSREWHDFDFLRVHHLLGQTLQHPDHVNPCIYLFKICAIDFKQNTAPHKPSI